MKTAASYITLLDMSYPGWLPTRRIILLSAIINYRRKKKIEQLLTVQLRTIPSIYFTIDSTTPSCAVHTVVLILYSVNWVRNTSAQEAHLSSSGRQTCAGLYDMVNTKTIQVHNQMRYFTRGYGAAKFNFFKYFLIP